MSVKSKLQTESTIFLRKFCPKELMKSESAGFLGASRQPCQRFTSRIYACYSFIPIPLRVYRFFPLRFNMASPIAVRLGLKNAGRLARFLSVTPKVCLKHAVVMTFQFFKVFHG